MRHNQSRNPLDVTKKQCPEKSAETLLVEKEALINAMLELERQEEIQTVIVLDTIHKLETLLQRLKETLQGERTLCAKHKLHQLFLPHSDWISILTDERIEAWQQEAKHAMTPSGE